MLTNCFRIFDEDNNQFLQAEVGLEISDLDQRVGEHRTLREYGIAQRAVMNEAIESRRNIAMQKMQDIYASYIKLFDKETRILQEYIGDISKQQGEDAPVLAEPRQRLEKLNGLESEMCGKNNTLMQMIFKAPTIDVLENCENELIVFKKEFVPDDQTSVS